MGNAIVSFLETFAEGRLVWTYLLAGELGLIFVVLQKTVAEQRFVKLMDLWTLVSYSFFVTTAVVLVDKSPALSFLIGLGCIDLWPQVRKGINRIGPNLAGLLFKGLSAVAPESETTATAATATAKGESTNGR